MFRVAWLKSARDELGTAWTDADSELRQAITRSAHLIDQALSRSPEQCGESRSGTKRVAFFDPLGVEFRISAAERQVVVRRVWLLPGKRCQ